MKKPVILTTIGLAIVVIAGLLIFKKPASNAPMTSNDSDLDLLINTIPLSERPFITLSPDSNGRSLDFSVSDAPTEGELEYELVYQAGEVQEGVFGRLNLETEKQPIIKSLLLGSKSAGGKVTYHEGVTGGSLTVTYGQPAQAGLTRLKESFNYTQFDPTDPILLSNDGRFVVTLTKTALKKDTRVLTMKTFGYKKVGLPESAKVIAGPYSIAYAETPKGEGSVRVMLPAGEHINPTLYEWDGKTWSKVASKLTGDSVTASSTNNVFVVTADY